MRDIIAKLEALAEENDAAGTMADLSKVMETLNEISTKNPTLQEEVSAVMKSINALGTKIVKESKEK